MNQLKNCLDSLGNQSIDDKEFEVIVVDDGSTDGTFGLGKSFIELFGGQLRFLRQENKGPAAARNLGFRHARGEIIVFIDDDCEPKKEWLEELVKGYEDPKVAGTGGTILIPTPTNLVDQYCSHIGLLKTPKMKKGIIEYVITANASFRKSVLEEVGGFDESFLVPGGEDPDLSYRIIKTGYKLLYNPKAVIYHYHFHTFGSLRRTFFNYGLGKAVFLIKNKKGVFTVIYEILSIFWFIFLAFIKIPSYIWGARGVGGLVFAFLDIYIRVFLRYGLVVGYIQYRRVLVK